MATNVTEKDKTLNEIIDWCTGMGQKMIMKRTLRDWTL